MIKKINYRLQGIANRVALVYISSIDYKSAMMKLAIIASENILTHGKKIVNNRNPRRRKIS